jgi:hypothetical protein
MSFERRQLLWKRGSFVLIQNPMRDPERYGRLCDRRLRSRWRVEPKRLALVDPAHRKIGQPFETEASGKLPIHRSLNDVRRQERERERHPDRALRLALPFSDAISGLVRVEEKPIQPTMSFLDEGSVYILRHETRPT